MLQHWLLSRHLFVCLTVCLSVWRQNTKKRDFLKKLSNFRGLYWRPIGSHTWAFQRTHYWNCKSKMAEIRRLENQHDVIFSAEGGPIWIKFCRLVQNDMWTAVMVKIETRCRIPIWRTSGRITWHAIPEPRTYHTAGCCHLVNSLSWFQSHMPHCRV